MSNLKKDPDSFAHAIDDWGYEILSMIWGQGLPPSIGLL